MTRQAAAFIGLTAIVSFLLGLVVAGTRPPAAVAATVLRAPIENPEPLNITSAAPIVERDDVRAGSAIDFASVAARINQAVVNVDTASRGREVRPRLSRRYSTDDPNAPRAGSGSGFIIDPAGFILTNHHVVAGADRVTVTLSDGRSMRAQVVGVDPAIDVALLQVHAEGELPVAPLGSSDSLRVGEWVCAIGNPLGVYVHSVTVGVVSFLGRKLFDQSLDAYIQTDAAISVGNSGGPLINGKGEVVGITTAMSAEAMNIGFAIPISQVLAILPQLREEGYVSRGYIGVGLTSITPTLRDALDLAVDRGALVQDVAADTPAARAGLRPYDVIVEADGRKIASDEELIRYVASRAPGTVTNLVVARDDGKVRVGVKLGVRQVTARGRRTSTGADARPVGRDESPLGLSVRELDSRNAERLLIPDSVQGVLVTEVDPAGPARLAQLRVNHVIMEVNRHPVRSVADYQALISRLDPGEAAALLVYDRTTSQRIICTVVADSES